MGFNMPLVIQALTYINPARYFLWILRGIVLRPSVGAGLRGTRSLLVAKRGRWQETLFMMLFATWIIVVSWNRLRRKVL